MGDDKKTMVGDLASRRLTYLATAVAIALIVLLLAAFLSQKKAGEPAGGVYGLEETSSTTLTITTTIFTLNGKPCYTVEDYLSPGFYLHNYSRPCNYTALNLAIKAEHTRRRNLSGRNV